MQTSERTILRFICAVIVTALPLSLTAETAKGVLYAKGTTYLNGAAVPNSSAIFPGDTVQTQSGSMANINITGSNVMISPDSTIKFSDTIMSRKTVAWRSQLRRAWVWKYATSRWCRQSPTNGRNIEFSRANGQVTIVAQTSDVNVTSGQQDTANVNNNPQSNDQQNATVLQGQQTTRPEHCVVKTTRHRRTPGAMGAGSAGLLSSPVVMWTGVAVVGGVTTWILLQGGSPLSPRNRRPSHRASIQVQDAPCFKTRASDPSSTRFLPASLAR